MVLFNKLIDTSLRFGFWCLTPLSTIFQLVLLVEKIGVLGESHLCRQGELNKSFVENFNSFLAFYRPYQELILFFLLDDDHPYHLGMHK